MNQKKGSFRKPLGPPPEPGELLDSLVWRQLGFEDQFGETFLDPDEEGFIPFRVKGRPEVSIRTLPELTP